MPADPKTSEGARKERKDDVAKLNRMKILIVGTPVADNEDYMRGYMDAVNEMINYKKTRQKRYDARKGGLGRK
jgi:hypothetical protein